MITARGTHAGRRMLIVCDETPDPGTFRPTTARKNTRIDRRLANAHWRVSSHRARCDINRNLLLENVGPHLVRVDAPIGGSGPSPLPLWLLEKRLPVILRCEMSLLALNCLHSERPAWQLSGVQRSRFRRGAAAVVDPFATLASISRCSNEAGFSGKLLAQVGYLRCLLRGNRAEEVPFTWYAFEHVHPLGLQHKPRSCH